MTKPTLVVCFIVLCSSACFSQDLSSEDTAFLNQVNLRLRTMYLALDQHQNTDSSLELMDYQKEKLAELAEEFSEMQRSLGPLPKAGDIQSRFGLFLGEMDSFERRLSSDILLPHQSTELATMVFTRMVKREGGNLISALTTHYPNSFQFSDDQKERMDKLKMSLNSKVREAKREFQEKLTKISSDAKTELRTILTPQQAQTLSDLTGDKK